MATNQPLPPLVKGDTRTLLDTDFGNRVVGVVNKLQTMEVRAANTGTSRIDMSGENAVLVLTRSDLARVLGTAALANITISNTAPNDSEGSDGDIWFVTG